jgi:hypothetical protein
MTLGDEHERLADSDIGNDFSLGAGPDTRRLSRLRATSEHRLVDCPLDAFNDHPNPSRHRHRNGDEVERSEPTRTHDLTVVVTTGGVAT